MRSLAAAAETQTFGFTFISFQTLAMATIFLSHASGDRILAMKVKAMLTGAFRAAQPRPSVFWSSDVGDIEGGKEWLDEIMRHLKQASVCVTLVTPRSCHGSPWVAYESGAAFLKFKAAPRASRLFPACAHGIQLGSMPSVFRHLQARDLSSAHDVVALIKEVASCISARCQISQRDVGSVVEEASKGPRNWEFVDQALIGRRQGSSPFSFESLVPEAKTEIACAGFNLRHIATSAGCKQAIFKFLKDSPECRVRLLIADPGKPGHLALWKLVGPTFLTDLKAAESVFAGWLRESKRKRLAGTLEVATTAFVGVTVVCVDPEGSNALLVLTPSIVGKPLSAERPHVVLTRSGQPVEFSYYWDAYQDLFRRATRLATAVKPNKALHRRAAGATMSGRR